MRIQETKHDIKCRTDSGSPVLILVGFVAAAMFSFPTVTRSQTAEWTVYNTTNSGLPYNGVTGLASDTQGNMWIGTGKWFAWAGGGLAKFDSQNWTVYNTSNSGLPNNDHTGLAIDPQGNVWSATEGGLGKFDGQNWTAYHTGNSGLPHNLVASPSFDAKGNLWVGTYGGGLAKFDGRNWTVYNTANSGLPHNQPWPTAIDVWGTVWIGTPGGGLAKFDGTNWTVYNTSNSGLPHNGVGSLCFDAQGNLWMASGAGRVVSMFDGANWSVYNPGVSNDIWDLAIDPQGNVWIATLGDGLLRLEGENWTVYNTSNSGLPDNKVYCLAFDALGNIWIGTESGGLAVYRLGERLPVVDFNGDGLVDIKDLLRIINSWDQDDPLIDIAPLPFGDGIVDALDLELLMSYWKQPIDDPTLVAHWAMDETEGDIAYDSAGVNDAVVVGDTTWQPSGGRVDGALKLDGISGFATTGVVLNPADGPFSVFSWIKGEVPGQVIISQSNGTNWLGADPEFGCVMTELIPPAVGRFVPLPLKSECVITDGQWHRIGFVWDGANRALYVDDILVAEDIQANLQGSDSGLYIGTGKAMEPGTYWSGLIDEVRIYHRAVRP